MAHLQVALNQNGRAEVASGYGQTSNEVPTTDAGWQAYDYLLHWSIL